jgi:hypothetical protein
LQYNGGANNYGIIDNSPFNNIITRAGNATQGTFSPYSHTGWSNYFSGASLNVPNSAALDLGSGAYTIEGWFNTNTTAGQQTIISFLTGFKLTVISTGLRVWGDAGSTYENAAATIIPGTWYHFAWVRSSTSLGKLYLDGVLILTVTSSNIVSSTPTGQNVLIGTYGDGYSNGFSGYISNLRVLKGTALYTSAFTPPTTPLTAIANTSLLTCQSNRFIDNSTTNATLTIYSGTPSVQAYSPFGSISEATPLSYSNYFAGGASDYLTVTTGSSQLNLPSDFTVELWFYETNTTPTIPRFAGSTSGGFACGINAYDGGATRKLDWRATGSAPVYGVTAITTNVWHHAAYVKSGSTFRIFLDGVLEYYNGSYSTTFTSTATYIGSANSADAAYSFRGYISNFRVVKGTAVYTTASTTVGATIFTPGTSPLTAIANTALLTCQSTRIIDNSTNALTMTGTGTYTVNQVNPFGYTAQSVTSYTPSLHGGSAYFDGTGDYLSAPASTAWNFTSDWTFECWIYPTAITGYHTFLGQWGAPDNVFIWKMNSSGRMYLENLSTAITATTTTIVANQWQHIALTRSSNTIRMFVNGVLDATTAVRSGTYYSSGAMRIGASGVNENFIGYMSDMRIINGTSLYTSNFVPPAQTLGNYSTTYPSSLLLNFTNGGIVDQHSTNVLETVGNAQLSTAVKKYNVASMYFDGTGDYLTMPSNQLMNFGTGDFTIESWLYLIAIDATASYIFDQRTADSQNVLTAYILPGGTIEIYVNGSVVASGVTIALNSWSHFAITRASNSLKMFLNGTQIGSTYSLTNTLITAPMYIGTRYNGTQYFNGYMDDFRVTKGYARYTSNFTAPTSALITK